MTRSEAVEANRTMAGLPNLHCPQCGKREPHWVPSCLDEGDLLVPGFFTCQPKSATVSAPLFDIGETP